VLNGSSLAKADIQLSPAWPRKVAAIETGAQLQVLAK
jgi:hypothetical protein